MLTVSTVSSVSCAVFLFPRSIYPTSNSRTHLLHFYAFLPINPRRLLKALQRLDDMAPSIQAEPDEQDMLRRGVLFSRRRGFECEAMPTQSN